MINIHLTSPESDQLNILCLGAHSDDIEIGCGGTILRLKEEYQNLSVTWVVFSARNERQEEAKKSAEALLTGVEQKTIQLLNFRDGYFPYVGEQIKDYFEVLKKEVSPDIIFSHFRSDLHQDHRLICELTWNTFRDHLILEYEIPKYDGDLGSPNFFIHLNEATALLKSKHLLTYFQTQSNKDWFTDQTFLSLLRIRGVESRAPEKFAEGFYCRKLVY